MKEKRNIKRNLIIKMVLFSTLLVCIVSCSQLFNNTFENISSDTTDDLCTVCKLSVSLTDTEGCADLLISENVCSINGKARSVFPTFPTSYKAKIWKTTESEPSNWTEPYEDLIFTLDSTAAATYNIELGFFDDDTLKFYADSVEVSIEDGQQSATCTVSVLPDDCTAADGSDYGDISLSLSEDADKIDTLSTKLIDSSSEEIAGVTWSADTVTASSITKGKYTLKIYGKDSSGNIIYIYTPETLYVWPGLTTNLWYDSSGDTSDILTITDDMYTAASQNTFCVSGDGGCFDAGDDEGDGGYGNPFATVSKAVDKCTSDTDCSIYIDGSISSDEEITIDDDKNITIVSFSDSSTDSISSDNFIIESGSTLIIENLTLSDASYSDGGCFHNGGILTLKGCTVQDCTATENGGAIYNSGILTLTDTTTSGNSASESGNVVYNTGTLNVSGSTLLAEINGIYLANSSEITVTDTLTQDFVANILSDAVPGNIVISFDGVDGSETVCNKFEYANDDSDGTDPDSSTCDVNENDGRNCDIYFDDSKGILTCDTFYVVKSNSSGTLTLDDTATETPDDSGTGSKQYPLATIQEAVTLINMLPETDDGYTIYVDGELLLSSTITLDSNNEITLSGIDSSSSDIISGGDIAEDSDNCEILSISSGTVNIQNLTLKNGYSSEDGGGIYNSGTLTLTDCSVTECTAEEYGAGIYNDGTLTLSGNTIIDTSSEDTLNDIYLPSGKTILLDDLTETDTVAEITPEVTDDDTVILKSSEELDYTTISRFILNVDNKCLLLSDDKLSSIIGVSKIIVNLAGEPITYTVDGSYDSDTNTVTFTIEDSSSTDISTLLDSWTITVFDSSKRETSVTSTGTSTQPSVTLELTSELELIDGTYNILLEFTYNDISYSTTVQIAKS